MEKVNNRYNLRSLPGVRRGASGAVAGCHSMRSIGDEELSRRAPIDKYATAEQGVPSPTSLISLFLSLSSSPPSYLNETPRSSLSQSPIEPLTLDVVQEENPVLANQSAPTRGAKSVRRKWTREMNMFIWRTYLVITELETIKLPHISTLHQKFTCQFPEMRVSKQRVGDQRRTIIRNQLLDTETLASIRADVEEMLQTSGHTQEVLLQTVEPNHRMRWTTELNEAIMKAYYKITNLETNTMG